MESKVKSVGNVSFPSNKLRGLANVLRFFVRYGNICLLVPLCKTLFSEKIRSYLCIAWRYTPRKTNGFHGPAGSTYEAKESI